MSAEGDSNEIKYSFNDYLGKFKDANPNEVIVNVRRELEIIKELILEESPCQIILPGSKSVDLYRTINDDFNREGFTICYIDIIRDKWIICSNNLDFNKDYIIVVDSSNSGTEVNTIIENMNGTLLRLFANVANEETIKNICKKNNISENIIYVMNKTHNSEEYKDKIIRNKLYGNATARHDSIGSSISEKEYITSLTPEQFACELQGAIREIMSCDYIELEKDEIFNLKLPKRVSIYTHDLNLLQTNCLKWFKFTFNEKSSPIFTPEILTIICKIEVRDVGHKLEITLDYPKFHNDYVIKNPDLCYIKRLVATCKLKETNLNGDAPELAIIKQGRMCAECIDNAILKEMRTRIHDNLELRLDNRIK